MHYKRLLVSKHGASTDSGRLTRDCNSLLEKLIELDPARRNRYREIGVYLRHLYGSIIYLILLAVGC